MNNTYTTYGVNGTSALDYAMIDDRSARIIDFPTASSQSDSCMFRDKAIMRESSSIHNRRSDTHTVYESRRVATAARAQHMNKMSDSLVVWDALGIDEFVDAVHPAAVPVVSRKEVSVKDKALLAVGFVVACVAMFL